MDKLKTLVMIGTREGGPLGKSNGVGISGACHDLGSCYPRTGMGLIT